MTQTEVITRTAAKVAKSVYIKTYGCQMNVYDSARMAELLAPLGFTVTQTAKAVLMGQVDTNLVTTFLCCRAACIAMAGRGGRIVNVTARPGLEWRTGAGMVAYTASKAAVAALTVALAQEVVKDGILVNAIAPSTIDTPANRKSMPDADHASWPKPDEIAQTIVFLASPANQVTRGAIVPVYGKV